MKILNPKPYNIRIRCMALGKELKTDMVFELGKRGVKISSTNLSHVLNDKERTTNKDNIVSICNDIVTEWEKEAK